MALIFSSSKIHFRIVTFMAEHANAKENGKTTDHEWSLLIFTTNNLNGSERNDRKRTWKYNPWDEGKNGNMILQNNKLKRTEGIENNTVIEGE